MRLGDVHLGYCTNIHPSETFEQLRNTLREDLAIVGEKIGITPGTPLGLGLRLGNTLATELCEDEARRERVTSLCRERGLYVFTVNAFPYGDFGADIVKTAVYEPSWLCTERLAYTQRVADVLLALPGPDRRSISTVAGCHRPVAHDDGAFRLIAANLELAARHLANEAHRTGIGIRLCLEPEPSTTLETTEEALAFFRRYLRPLGSLYRDHLGLCFDCCHQAVVFDHPTEDLARLADAGIAIGKVQITSALHLDDPTSHWGREALQSYAEPRYLHQVVARLPGGGRLTALDLGEVAEPNKRWLGADAWRCHFHVPIWWRGDERLGSTRAFWEAAVDFAVAHKLTEHLEIETYTFGVLGREWCERAETKIHECIAAEFAAVFGRLTEGYRKHE